MIQYYLFVMVVVFKTLAPPFWWQYHQHMASEVKCIYCPNTFDPTQGEGDHIIPPQLGEFRGDIRFRWICPECNSKIGQSEQQMVQSGPEGFFRQIIKPKSKRLNRRGIGRPRGAMGAPPPQHMVDMGDHYALVETTLDNPKNVNPVDHIYVRDVDDKETHIRLYPGIRAEQVREALEKSGIGTMKAAHLHSGEEKWDEYTSLLNEIWPGSKFEERESTPAGVFPDTPGTSKYVVNTHYFRAIAKMAFHYFLIHSHRGFRGNEPYFTCIRNFILNGGNSDQFFKCENRPTFMLPFRELPDGGVITPSQWCHVLAASEAGGQAVAYVNLFLGPGCISTSHYVWLGRWDSPIISLNSTWAHAYLYDDPQQDGRYAGRVEKTHISQILP